MSLPRYQAHALSRIHQLPPEVVTKIAAGEVIERPASVVKELLENAIDAGANRIEIDIEQGGAELIRIVDNGCGILPDDLPLAFASHATSKLGDADDLFRVHSLGFRGEALASIGGVAQVVLQSRLPQVPVGAEIRCEGGRLSAVRPWNGTPGTRIEVRHLFFNTPVRRKFLRSTATEMSHIAEAVTRQALAHGSLHFKLTHNDRSVWEVPTSAGLAERIGLFFGKEVRDKLIPIDTGTGMVRLSGYIVDPACDRGNPRMQYFFVNGRWIRDRALTHALQEAYRGLLMTGRYCVAFLFIELPPDQVDVNVHPTKVEVRFRDAQALYHLVLATLREKLRSLDLVPQLRVAPFPPQSPGFAPSAALPRDPWPGPASQTVPASSPTSIPTPEQPPKAIQLYDAYLVVETPHGMLVIDQHALHERILYEDWKARIRDGQLECQKLLVR